MAQDPRETAKLLVHGFVRDMERATAMVDDSGHNVLDVYNLINSFHFVSDVWDQSLTCNKFQIEGDYLTLNLDKCAGIYNEYCNAFGSIKVKLGEKKLWRIKICELDPRFWAATVSLSIGIIDAALVSKIGDDKSFYDHGYGFIAGNAWLKHKSIPDIFYFHQNHMA